MYNKHDRTKTINVPKSRTDPPSMLLYKRNEVGFYNSLSCHTWR